MFGFSARKYRSTIPSQKTGIEMPTNARIVINRSDHLPAFTAEKTPTSVPKKSQMIAAPMQRENVAGMPFLISLATFWRFWNELRMSYWPCLPGRKPLAAFSIIFTYCT